MSDDPHLPAYDARLHQRTWCRRCCTTHEGDLDWVPPVLLDADRVVLLVIDGLGLEPAASRAAT